MYYKIICRVHDDYNQKMTFEVETKGNNRKVLRTAIKKELIKFLRAWLYIPDLMRYDMQNKSWFENPKLEDIDERKY